MAKKTQSIQKALQQHWVHSHEEDTDTEMVFRPATFNFPRSRGRRAFELKPDGSMVEGGIAPADGRQEAQGTWELEDDNRLILYPDSPAGRPRVMQITSVDKDRLVVKKISQSGHSTRTRADHK
jgi:hypothetical protein